MLLSNYLDLNNYLVVNLFMERYNNQNLSSLDGPDTQNSNEMNSKLSEEVGFAIPRRHKTGTNLGADTLIQEEEKS